MVSWCNFAADLPGPTGATQLTTDEGFLSKLVHCIREIISSRLVKPRCSATELSTICFGFAAIASLQSGNSILDILGSALEKVIQIFGQIKDAVSDVIFQNGWVRLAVQDAVVSIMSKLGGRRHAAHEGLV